MDDSNPIKQLSDDIVRDAVIAAVAGLVASVAVIPFSVFAFIVCAVLLLSNAFACMRFGQLRLAVFCVVLPAGIFSGIVTGAALYRPIKTVHKLMEQEVSLPSKSMTLAEIYDYTNDPRNEFPARVSIDLAAVDENILVKWPNKKLTLHQYIDSIESQTPLRHHARGCGNSYTVLYGHDVCFGLTFYDPGQSRQVE